MQNFELLGSVVDVLGTEAVSGLVANARDEWANGRPGPVLQSPDGEQPRYALAVGPVTTDFRLGTETGRLPTDTLLALAGIVQAPSQPQ